MLTIYLLLAVVTGAGVTLVARGVFAPAPKLSDIADGSYRARSAVDPSAGGRLRAWLLQALPPHVTLPKSLHADLRLTRTVEEAHTIAKFTAAAAGAAIGIGVMFVAGLVGWNPAWAVPAVPVLAAGSFFLPDLSVRSQAAERRQEFTSAFAAYLDLTRILMGASDGPESALEKAAEKGHGWVFAELRRAMNLARSDQSLKHWDALAQVGQEFDLVELREFADAMAATSTSSALPDTLGARAAAMRTKALRGIEGQADQKTEQMDIPLTLLTTASTIFIMYAALSLASAPTAFS